MKLEYDDVFVSEHANVPGRTTGYDLPEEVSAEAAYILTEVVLGKGTRDIANELDISRNSVYKTLDNLKDKELIDYPEVRRGRDYSATKEGKEIMKSYMIQDPLAENTKGEKESLEKPRMILGNFEFASASEEVEILLSYLGSDDRNLDELKEDYELRQDNLTRLRESLHPLMEEKTENYTITYEPTQLGIQVLGHLSMNFHLSQEVEDEDMGTEKQKDERVDWSQIT